MSVCVVKPCFTLTTNRRLNMEESHGLCPTVSPTQNTGKNNQTWSHSILTMSKKEDQNQNTLPLSDTGNTGPQLHYSLRNIHKPDCFMEAAYVIFTTLCGASTVAIDNKIEQAMDLVKSHLMFAVREEVEVLKEQIKELLEKNSQLEYENSVLKANATQETLTKLQQSTSTQPPTSNS